jgi:transcription termination/antitermination protein NusA
MVPDLNRVIEQVGRDKGIDKEILIDALEIAMITAAKKLFGVKKEIEAHYNEELGEVELFEFREVADVIEDPDTQISLEDAADIDLEAEIGDSLGVKLDTSSFGRISAQTAKQVIIQRVREAEREIIYNSFRERKGEIISGIVRRFEKKDVIVDLGRAEARLPREEQIPRENYRVGDRVRCFCLDIQKTSRGPQIILSRTHPHFLIKLFEAEVPEIYEGIVEIAAVAREPGSRAKIAVSSEDSDVDPVGACVGMKGARVQAVVQELRGEKIDIVPSSPDHARFVVNALAPAEISQVVIDDESGTMEIIVPDDQLSLAIGRRGQNVRLAAQLSGWKIDIKSETELAGQTKDVVELLKRISGVGNELIPHLSELGLYSVNNIVEATIEELMEIPSVGPKTAESIIEHAKAYLVELEGDSEEESTEAETKAEEQTDEESTEAETDAAEQTDEESTEAATDAEEQTDEESTEAATDAAEQTDESSESDQEQLAADEGDTEETQEETAAENSEEEETGEESEKSEDEQDAGVEEEEQSDEPESSEDEEVPE